MFTGAGVAVLSPSLNPAVFAADVQVYLESVAANSVGWMWAQGLIIAGGMVTLLGLVALALRFRGSASQWGWIGVATYALSTVFLALNRFLDMAAGALASALLADADSLKSFITLVTVDEILGDWWGALAYLARVAMGMALTRADGHREIGWLFVVVGLGGLMLDLASVTIPAMIFAATAALGVATWRIQPAATFENHSV